MASSSGFPAHLLSAAVVGDGTRGTAGSQWATWNGGLWLVAAAPIVGEQAGAPTLRHGDRRQGGRRPLRRGDEPATGSQIAFVLGRRVVAVSDRAIRPLVTNIEAAPAGHGVSVSVAKGYSGARQALPLDGGQASMIAAETRKPIVDAQRQLLSGRSSRPWVRWRWPP